MIEIRLSRDVWFYDPAKPLGPPGGFGAVFAGIDSKGNGVAVKRLHIDVSDTAHRELTIAYDLSGRNLKHVIPIFDAGQDANSDRYFVVMPIAEYSLRDFLDKNATASELEASSILSQIADGLREVEHLVHRDLKPGNVLWHEGRWKVADFGIARFVEDSTSLKTLKECLTPTYAAPEQWRLEHATGATDVYALGCIAHELMSGKTPFSGTVDVVRNGHLFEAPPPMSGASSLMQTLVSMMLRKSPAARPSLARIKTVLEQSSDIVSQSGTRSALDRLAASAAEHERVQSQSEAEQEYQLRIAAERESLASDAQAILREVVDELKRRVANSIPNVIMRESSGSLQIRIASAILEIETGARVYAAGSFPRSKWDVICGSAVGVEQSNPHHRRSASLWYTRRNFADAEYRWYEVGYESNPMYSRRFEFHPVALDPEKADRAHWNGIDVVQESYAPVPIDSEDIDAFCTRWLHIFASACDHKMQHLSSGLPRV